MQVQNVQDPQVLEFHLKVAQVMGKEQQLIKEKAETWRVRASAAGKLMTNAKGTFTESNQRRIDELVELSKQPKLTEKQAAERRRLLDKKEDGGITDKQAQKLQEWNAKLKSDRLTPKQRKELEELQEKKKQPFQLSDTAKTMISDSFLQIMYGAKDPVWTWPIMKGHMCEQDSLALVQQLIPSEAFRVKNKKHYKTKYTQGKPDVQPLPEGVSEDVKSSWNLRTFLSVKSLNPDYFGQGQVYMGQQGTDRYRLHYCLVDTPEEIIRELEKSLFFKFGSEENPHYLEACEELRSLHEVEHRIPAELRLKTFGFERDDDYLKELYYRVKHAREYFASLSLNNLEL